MFILATQMSYCEAINVSLRKKPIFCACIMVPSTLSLCTEGRSRHTGKQKKLCALPRLELTACLCIAQALQAYPKKAREVNFLTLIVLLHFKAICSGVS
jgi:hypothetical protein